MNCPSLLNRYEFILPKTPTPMERVRTRYLDSYKIELWMKRDDLTGSHIFGNKLRKLKYNIIEAKLRGTEAIATFGGPYSNHIYATAAAGRIYGIKTIGFIRGEKPPILNDVLFFAEQCGMDLIYVDRDSYRLKNRTAMARGHSEEPENIFWIPEGGANWFGLRGCQEIVPEIAIDFDLICCACGTGTTLAGLAGSLKPTQRALGFAVLKGADFLFHDVRQWLVADQPSSRWDINLDYHFGGYAKRRPELDAFISDFKNETGITLDHVYTGKMLYGVMDLIASQKITPGTRVVVLHTGGYIPRSLGLDRLSMSPT